MSELTHIVAPEPRRTWLMHCNDAFGDLGVCEISVNNGAVAIVSPAGDPFELDARGIAQFRDAFAEAIAVAEADLRARAARRAITGES